MGDVTVGKQKTRICKNCGKAKIRSKIRVNGSGSYRYWCACDSWKESLMLLDKVRRRKH